MLARHAFRKQIATLYLPGLLVFTAMGMRVPIVPLYVLRLGASIASAGLVIAAGGLGGLLFNIPSGMIVSRLGNRRLLLISTVAIAISAVAMGASRSVPSFGVWSFLSGSAYTAWFITRSIHIRQNVSANSRGGANSALGGLMRIGGFIGPVAGGLIAQRVSYSSVFYFEALISASSLLFYARGHASDVKAPRLSTSATLRSVPKIFGRHRKQLVRFGILLLLYSAVRSARAVIFPIWGDSIDLNAASIGVVVGLSSALDALLFVPAGFVMDRKGRKWVGLPSILVMAISFLLLSQVGGYRSLLVIGGLIGLGNGFSPGLFMTLGTDLAPDDHAEIFLGIWFFLVGIGRVIAPLVVGFTASSMGLEMAPIAIGVLGVAGFLYLLLFIPETRPRS